MIKSYSFHGISIRLESKGVFPFECFERLFGLKPSRAGKNPIKLVFAHVKAKTLKPKKGYTTVSLKRERNIKGYYIKNFLLLSDSRSSVEINYSKSEAKFFMHDSILKHAKVFTHTLLPLALVELLKKRNFYYLHAACADIAGKGILFIGSPGAGKTSACYSILKQGASWVSDDAVLIRERNGKITAYSFIREFSLKVGKDAIFPELKRIRSGGKVDLYKRGLLFSSFKKSTLPKVIVNVDRSGRKGTQISKIRASDIIGKIISENEFLLLDRSQTHKILDALGLLCRQAACLSLLKRDLILKPRAFFRKITQFLN